MKTLVLNDFLTFIEGRVIHGDTSQIIKNAANYGEHLITDHTVVFILKKKNEVYLPSNASSLTVITSTPELIKNRKKDTTVVKVSNPKKAYSRFIYYYRSLFQIPVIGVTGTCGKTTTKEMISWILSKSQKVVSTYLSHNGLGRNLDYLLSIDDSTDSAVFEMGVSGPNQLLYSAHYFRPQIGIITTIGTDHIEGFKSQDSYVKEKTKMVKAVGKNGTIIINADDENCRKINLQNFNGTVILYGTHESAHFRAHSITFNLEKGGMDFNLVCREGQYFCFVPGFGTHNVYNAIAAIIASNQAGVKVKEAIKRLKTFKHVKSHLQFHKGINGSVIIDDTWNTNPTSIEAALEVLKETANGKKTVAVIGEIEELGTSSLSEHQKIGSLVASKKIDHLVTIGKNTIPICRRARELGMPTSSIHNVTSKSELLKLLDQVVDANTSVLLKTSMRKSFKDTLNKLIVKD